MADEEIKVEFDTLQDELDDIDTWESSASEESDESETKVEDAGAEETTGKEGDEEKPTESETEEAEEATPSRDEPADKPGPIDPRVRQQEAEEQITDTQSKDDIIAALQKQINEQAGLLAKLQQTVAQSPSESQQQPAEGGSPKVEHNAPQFTPSESGGEVYDYIGDNDIDDLLGSKDQFNRLAAMVEQRAARRAMLSIPQVVTEQVREKAAVDSVVSEFYEANPDLAHAKQAVRWVGQQVAANNPDWDIKAVLKESAKQARMMLRLPDPSVEPPASDKQSNSINNPAFATGSRGRKQGPQLSKLQQEIDEL